MQIYDNATNIRLIHNITILIENNLKSFKIYFHPDLKEI